MVQRELETMLAKALLRGEFVEEDTVVVGADEKASDYVGQELRLTAAD